MNYEKIYNAIVARAKSRSLNQTAYYESHHIVPRCLNGTDDPDNLVMLTGAEHRTAHLCLVKMNPGHHGLVKAAMMMNVRSCTTHRRSKSKQYEWLKRLHSLAMSNSQSGCKNSQYGKVWVYNIAHGIEKKIIKSEAAQYITDGWILGRTNTKIQTCVVCNNVFVKLFKKQTCSKECYATLVGKHKMFSGREKEFLDLYADLKSMNKALKVMGFPGAVSQYYHWAKTLI